jgi:hypothetical protein
MISFGHSRYSPILEIFPASFDEATKAAGVPFFQCRVFGDDPVAEPRCAAGGRSSNIIISVRPERPSSIVRPQPDSAKTESAKKKLRRRPAAAPRRPRRKRVGPIAGRSARGSLC